MKSKLFIILGVGVLVVLGGLYFVFPKATKVGRNDSTDSSSVADEVVQGSLKAIVEMGVPLKCTYELNGVEYEGVVKGRKYKGQMTLADGREGNVIMLDECMYTWAKGDPQGMKICFTEDDTSMWEETGGTMPGEYNCRPAAVLDSTFDVPQDVEFLDLESMMQGMMNP